MVLQRAAREVSNKQANDRLSGRRWAEK